MDILNEIFSTLKTLKKENFFKYNIKEIFLELPYTIVELENGHQGIAANYDYLDQRKLDYVQEKLNQNIKLSVALLEKSKKDPLLCETLLIPHYKNNLTLQSIRVAILAALSGGTEEYLNSRGITISPDISFKLDDLSIPGDSIAFIGFSGNIVFALKSKNFKKIFVSDCLYTAMKLKMAKLIQMAHPDKNISFTDLTHNTFILKQSSVTWITASSLCNDTINSLLTEAINCREVILQGASGSIFPVPFFENGVTRILCPDIDFDFLSSAKKFMKGKEFEEYFMGYCSYMDNALKSQYLTLTPER